MLETSDIVIVGLDSIDICVTLNQSGNLEADDIAYLAYTIDGVVIPWDTLDGSSFTSVSTFCKRIGVPDGSVLTIRVTYENDAGPEKWFVKDGDISICPPPIPLPIELNGFSYEILGKDVLLKWSTASEFNNDYFEVQRFNEDIKLTTIGHVSGIGNSTSLIEYSFIDDRPLSGVNYYRLKQVDIDDNFDYSETISVKCDVLDDEEFLIVLYDVYGRNIYMKTKIKCKKDELLSVISDEFASGIYLIVGSSNNDFFSKKMIIK
jgi:hypothetical protein